MAKVWDYLSIWFELALWSSILHPSPVSSGLIKEVKGNDVLLPNSNLQRFERALPELCNNLECAFTIDAAELEEFKELIIRENALAIFLFVNVGNSTAHDKTSGKFLEEGEGMNKSCDIQVRKKWAWLRDKRGKFLATLPYDFDILSLTILKRDAFSRTLSLTTTPRHCYANLTRDCLDSLIATTIKATLTGSSHGDLCVKTEEKEDHSLKTGGYRCCEQINNTNVCDKLLENNQWIEIATWFAWACSIGFGLFAPLLFKYLPKEFKKGPRIRTRAVFARTDSEITETSSVETMLVSKRPVMFALDDGMLDVLRTQTESVFFSRLSRCIFVILLSCLPLLQGFIYAYLKKGEVGITTGELLGVGDAFITLMEPGGRVALSAAYGFCILLMCIAIAIPRTLSDFARRLSGRRDERTFLGFRKPDEIICTSDKRGFQLIYENMAFHLNCLLMLKFWKFVFFVISYPLLRLCSIDVFEEDLIEPNDSVDQVDGEGRCGLCSTMCKTVVALLFFPFWTVTIATAFIMYIFPVTYVGFRIWKMLFRIEIESPCCQSIPSFVRITSFPVLYILFIVFCICVEASYLMLAVTLTFNIMFLGSVVGFTIIGLLFYIDIYLPYIVLGLWVILYILRGTNKYYAQFTNLKTIVFEECEKFDEETRKEASIRETFGGPATAGRRSPSVSSLPRSKSAIFLVTVDDYGVPSIPLDIFLASSCKLMPFKRIMLAKFLKVIALGSYLVVIFLFVMSLVEYKAANTIVQGLALLFLGGLPLLALQSRGHHSEAEEIRARFYIKDFIKQYSKRSL